MIDGVTLDDVCIKGGACLNEACKLYHPSWENFICLFFIKEKCGKKNCSKFHKKWEDLVHEIDPEESFDIFTKKKYIKQKQIGTNSQSNINSSMSKGSEGIK